jgi:hypothetical protein
MVADPDRERVHPRRRPQHLEDRQEGNVVRLFRNVTTPGSQPRELAWLEKEPNPYQGVLKDTFAVYGANYIGGSVDIDSTIEFVNSIGSGSCMYTGPKTELQD